MNDSYSEENSSFSLGYQYYYDKNKVIVHEPFFQIKKKITRLWFLAFKTSLDITSGASRRLGEDLLGIDATTQASPKGGSGDNEVRKAAGVNAQYSDQGTVFSGGLDYGKEDDYLSYSINLSASQDFAQRNTTLGGGVAYYKDKFSPTGYFASEGGAKNVSAGYLNLTQSLTPITLFSLTFNYIQSNGYLGHPYTPPRDQGGNLITESLPTEKKALALTGEFIQGYLLKERLGSVNFEYRRYYDYWGMGSHTIDMKWSQYITEGTYFRIRGRYYNQSGSDFAKAEYLGNEKYRTADIRQFPFYSYMAGVKWDAPLSEAWDNYWFLPDRYSLNYDHTWRNTKGEEGKTIKFYHLYNED